MILCLKCKRLWTSGTQVCGVCRATIGCRKCPEGHRSPLIAKSCTTCGVSNLTDGVPALNLRPITVVGLCAVGFKVVPPIVHSVHIGELLNRAYWFFLNEVLSRAILYAIVALLIGWLLGPKALNCVQNFWSGVLRLFLDGVVALGRWILSKLIQFAFQGPRGGSK